MKTRRTEPRRSTLRWRWCAALLSLCALSCVRPLPPDYLTARQAATRAQHDRRFAEAARSWQTAAEHAARPEDRDEALYRAATAWRRALAPARGEAILRRLAARPGPRRARAHLDLARWELERGRHELALRLLQDVVELFPASGLARPALERALAHYSKLGASEAHVYLLRTLRGVEEPSLREVLLHHRARLFEAQGRPQRAIAAYQSQVEQHPYPQGLLWDDAMLRLAKLQRAHGQVDDALATLRAMLEQRESAWLVGSYERRYSQARWLMADILERDARRPRQAVHHYLLLAELHPHSLLRDDAWWAAARLSQRLGEAEQACDYLQKLQLEVPDSRFTGCATLICPRLSSAGRCRDYIERALRSETPAER